MKDNYVVLYEIENEGSYEVAINTHLGVFVGYTEVDEIDAKYPSSFHASEIALSKALRKFAEAAVSRLKSEIKLISGMITQAVDFASNRSDIDNTSFRILNGTLKQKQKDLKKWEARVKALSDSIQKRIAARDKIVKKYIEADKPQE